MNAHSYFTNGRASKVRLVWLWGVCLSGVLSVLAMLLPPIGFATAQEEFEPWPDRKYFNVELAIQLPQLDANGDGVNDFSGIQFEIRFTFLRNTSSHCFHESESFAGAPVSESSEARPILTVQDDGSVRGTWRLVDSVFSNSPRPEICSYGILWPSMKNHGLVLQSDQSSSVVSALDKTVSAVYHARPVTSFSPPTWYSAVPLNIVVPQLDANGDGVNDFSGARLVLPYVSRGLDAASGCTYFTSATYVVQDDGSMLASSPSLVDNPLGSTHSCQYTIQYPNLNDWGLQLKGRAKPYFHGWLIASSRIADMISAAKPLMRRRPKIEYVVIPASSLSPKVTISVPQQDDDKDGVNDFSGIQFEVTFSPESGSNPGCTSSAIGNYVVQDSGSVSGSPPVLVDRPEGVAARCSYEITWPVVTGLVRQSGATATASVFSSSASASYRVTNITSFTPDVDISVPQQDDDKDGVNDFSGIQFEVTFSPESGSNPGCTSSVIGNYVVQDSGSVSGSPPVLVDRPEGVAARCSYEITWPVVTGLVRQSGATATASASAKSVSAVYRAAATSFTPDVDISVPQTDADRDGDNDFAGRRFTVTFRSVFGSDAGCTNATTTTYVVQDNGTVTGTAPSLTNRPGSVTTGCTYVVSWPVVTGLVRQSGATALVGASAKSVSAVYRATDATSFSPDVDISVPQVDADGDGANDFSGRRFAVTFWRASGSNSGCTSSAIGNYVVQDSGSVSGSPPVLVDRPEGVARGCLYVVNWPMVSGLVRQSGATALVGASAKSVSAVYRATDATSFSPDVDISVPQVDADGDGANDFSGRRFAVTFRRVFGSDAGCTNSANGTYIVQDSGVVTGLAPSLVDRPAGVTMGCIYAVSWPILTDLVRQFGATTTVSASAKTVSATYQTGPTYVAPEPVVEEPEVEAPVVEEPSVEEPVIEEPQEETATEPEDGEAGGPEAEGTETQAPDGSQAGGGDVAGGADAGSGVGVGANVGSDSGDDVSGSVPVASAPEVGVIQLPQGWVMLPFNGPSGMTPADFAQALEGAINSVWVWDMSAQQWKGWTASRGSIGLASLTPGDVVMVYAPTGGVVVYSPADLLGHRVGVNSWTLAPTGISLVVYGGGTATSASDVFASYANSAVVVYLWDSQNQRWEYHLPGRQPLSSVQVPWFSDINPGDAMFVYNISPTAVTIPWQ